jgi:5-methylcytosine-specific restriction endonuclease McrA
MEPAPEEYLYGPFFERVRRRFELCGTRRQADGTVLILKCLGCGHYVTATWLKKSDDEEWCGEFGKTIKHRLSCNHTHRNCKAIIEETHKQQLKDKQEAERLQVARDDLVRGDDRREIERLRQENAKLREKHATLIQAIKKQQIKLKRPAMTQPRRLEIAASQEWKCGACNMLLTSSFEIDHIYKWSESFDDSRENLEAKCRPCHAKKTADELSV